MVRDDPFRSAPLRIPEPPPPPPPRPWPPASGIQHLRHGVMILGIAVMSHSMLFPLRAPLAYRLTMCPDAPRDPGAMCGHSCSTVVLRDPAAELLTGVMVALLVAFVGFLLGHSHWLVRSAEERPAGTQWARTNALLALSYAGLGFLVTAFWAPYSVERPVLTPVFLALCVVTLITRAE